MISLPNDRAFNLQKSFLPNLILPFAKRLKLPALRKRIVAERLCGDLSKQKNSLADATDMRIAKGVSVHPWGVEPQSSEPESDILSIELRVQISDFALAKVQNKY